MSRPGSSTSAYDSPGFYTGTFCSSCPGAGMCGARGTAGACGHSSEYRPHVVLPAALRRLHPDELVLPVVPWAPLPRLPAVIMVAHAPRLGLPIGIRFREAVREQTWRKEGADSAVAVLFSDDTALDNAIWRQAPGIASQLRSWAVRLAFAPGYSTWRTDPPSENLTSMVRTLEVGRILSKCLPTVPSIVWTTHRDLARWSEWLIASNVTAFSVDFQTLRSRGEWKWGIDGLRHLQGLLPRPVPQLAVNGPSVLGRVRDLRDSWPGDVTVLSQHPWQQALHGRLLRADGGSVESPELDRDELLLLNVQTFQECVASILESNEDSTSARTSS